jgi:hypothetical protein
MLFNRVITQNAKVLKFSTLGSKIPTMVPLPWSTIDGENLRASFCENKKEERNQEERSRILKAQFNMMDKLTKMPASNPEEELKVRLATCGYHRALLKMPHLYHLAEGRLGDPVRIDGDTVALFTSENRLRTFYADDNNLSGNVQVHQTPGSILLSELPGENGNVIIDFERETGHHSGKVTHGQQAMLLNAQSTALTFKKFFDRGELSGRHEVDNVIVTVVVSQEGGKVGTVHTSGNSDASFVSMFASQVHSEILLHTLRTTEPGTPWGVMQGTWAQLRPFLSGSNLPNPGYAPCVGITLDRLPDAWTNIVGEDWVEDLLDLDTRNVSLKKS